ncbi:MAG: glycosyltransferase family 39 protein [Candidatus Omnitrophica bacterium]|nr:glycosyltransferase family 39 protein [Candidatus Omnitrophota bacterium]
MDSSLFSNRSNKTRFVSGLIPVVAILILNAYVLKINAFRNFDFLDMGSYLDASWRVYLGQRPYVDFLYFSGPVHLYINAFFFHLFGFGKAAILAHLVAAHSAAIVLTFLIARKHTPVRVSIICMILTTACFYWPVSHPWHNQTAHLWGLLSIGALYFNIPFRSRKEAIWTVMLSGFFCGIALLTKINLGAAYGLIALAVLLSSSFRRISISSFATGILLFLGMMSVFMTQPRLFLEQTFSYYNQVSRLRAPKLLSLNNWFANDYWVFVTIILVNMRGHFKLLRSQPFRQHLILLVGIFFAGIAALQTDAMSGEINIFLWGITASFAFVVILQIRKACAVDTHQLRHRASTTLLTLFSLFLIVKAASHGINLTKWSFLNRIPVGDYVMKSRPLQGWLSNEEQGKAFDGLAEFINQRIPKHESLLILTDMQILYPITGWDSYRGITFTFFANPFAYFPLPGKQQKQVTQRILNNPPDWIITHDRNREYKAPTSYVASLVPYLELTDFIDSSYEIVKEVSPYQILRRKQAPG